MAGAAGMAWAPVHALLLVVAVWCTHEHTAPTRTQHHQANAKSSPVRLSPAERCALSREPLRCFLAEVGVALPQVSETIPLIQDEVDITGGRIVASLSPDVASAEGPLRKDGRWLDLHLQDFVGNVSLDLRVYDSKGQPIVTSYQALARVEMQSLKLNATVERDATTHAPSTLAFETCKIASRADRIKIVWQGGAQMGKAREDAIAAALGIFLRDRLCVTLHNELKALLAKAVAQYHPQAPPWFKPRPIPPGARFTDLQHSAVPLLAEYAVSDFLGAAVVDAMAGIVAGTLRFATSMQSNFTGPTVGVVLDGVALHGVDSLTALSLSMTAADAARLQVAARDLALIFDVAFETYAPVGQQSEFPFAFRLDLPGAALDAAAQLAYNDSDPVYFHGLISQQADDSHCFLAGSEELEILSGNVAFSSARLTVAQNGSQPDIALFNNAMRFVLASVEPVLANEVNWLLYGAARGLNDQLANATAVNHNCSLHPLGYNGMHNPEFVTKEGLWTLRLTLILLGCVTVAVLAVAALGSAGVRWPRLLVRLHGARPALLFDRKLSILFRVVVVALALTAVFGLKYGNQSMWEDLGMRVDGPNSTVDLDHLVIVSISSTVENLHDIGSYRLASVIKFFSQKWPFLKIGAMVLVWVLPPYWLLGLSESTMMFLDLLGKWSKLDFFIIYTITPALHLTAMFYDPKHHNSFSAAIYMRPQPAWASFVAATILSLVLTHIILYAIRWRKNQESRDRGLKAPVGGGAVALRCRSFLAAPGLRVRLRAWVQGAIPVALAGAFVAILAICNQKLLTLQFTGLIEVVLGALHISPVRHVSLWSNVNTFRYSTGEPNGIMTLFLAAAYSWMVLVAPLLHVLLLLTLWFAPLRRRGQWILFRSSEIVYSWCCLDVFLVCTVIVVTGIRQVSVIGPPCYPYVEYVAKYPDSVLAQKYPACLTCSITVAMTTFAPLLTVTLFHGACVLAVSKLSFALVRLSPAVDPAPAGLRKARRLPWWQRLFVVPCGGGVLAGELERSPLLVGS